MLMPFFSPVTAAGPVTPDFHAFGEDADGWIRGLVLGDGSLTFARSSTATVTDWEGLVKTVLANELRIKNARRVENLVSASEVFTGWDVSNASVSVNTVTASGANGTLTDAFTAIAADYVFSCKLKRVTGTGNIQIAADDGTWTTVTLTGAYQRFSVQQTLAAGTKNYGVRLVTSGDEVDIDEAQLELVEGQTNQNPSEYVSVGVESGDYHGVGVDGVAYLDYENGNTVSSNVVTEAAGSDLTTAWGALYEPAATNLISYSEEFENAWWNPSAASITDTSVSGAPDGTSNAREATTTSNFHSIKPQSPMTVTASTDYVLFFWAKRGTQTDVKYSAYDVSSTSNIIAPTSYYSQINSSTYTLIEMAFTTPVGCTQIYIYPLRDSGAQGTTYIFGAALALGTRSSYIPTSGATATRTADDGDGAFSYTNWNQTEGTLIVDLVMQEETNQGIFNVANAEAGVLSFDTTNEFQTDDGTNQANVDPTLASNLGDTIRFAIDYKTNLVVGYKNITDAGSWVWDADSASYDGAFATNSVINIFYDLATVSQIKDVYYYSTEQGKAFVEANY